MTDFRIYCLDANNRIVSAFWVEAANDDEATAHVTGKGLPHDCEIWVEARKVARVLKASSPSERV